MPRILLLLSVVLSACTSQNVPPVQSERWRELKAQIRSEFDDVVHLTIDQYRQQRQDKTPVIDVRAAAEFEVSHLPGALSLPMGSDFGAQLSGLKKDELVVVYCSVGWRSSIAAQQLRSLGFTKVVNLEGSIFEWANRQLPLEGKEAARGLVHPFDEDWGQLVDAPHRAALK